MAPNSFENFNTFSKIIFLDPILHTGFLSCLNKHTKAEIYLPYKTKFSFSTFKKLDISRQLFGKYFRLIQFAFDNKIKGDYQYDFYEKLIRLVGGKKDYNYLQFYVCLMTFVDLKIVEVD